MNLPEPRTSAGADAWRAVLERPGDTLLGLDFDGTLAPIVDDPEQAYANPDAVAALGRLGPLVGSIMVITGRPARTAVRLGRFAETPGLESMVVLGQYGVERWSAATGEFIIPPDPAEITAVAEEVPGLLDDLDLPNARIEHKGRAVGVHTRGLRNASNAFARLLEPIRDLAARYNLRLEPGKNVLEIRAPGTDKGVALRAALAETGARQVIFAGDDLGDLPAFETVRQLREEGVPGLLVCSASQEEDALTSISDVVVDGSAGMAAWLTALADRLTSASDAAEPA